jgi:26S proteasome regulatory subunit N8
VLKETGEALLTKSDDAAFMVFVSQLTRSVVTLHDLVNRRNPPAEKPAEKKGPGEQVEEKKAPADKAK